jgi:hypothetical protein
MGNTLRRFAVVPIVVNLRSPEHCDIACPQLRQCAKVFMCDLMGRRESVQVKVMAKSGALVRTAACLEHRLETVEVEQERSADATPSL